MLPLQHALLMRRDFEEGEEYVLWAWNAPPSSTAPPGASEGFDVRALRGVLHAAHGGLAALTGSPATVMRFTWKPPQAVDGIGQPAVAGFYAVGDVLLALVFRGEGGGSGRQSNSDMTDATVGEALAAFIDTTTCLLGLAAFACPATKAVQAASAGWRQAATAADWGIVLGSMASRLRSALSGTTTGAADPPRVKATPASLCRRLAAAVCGVAAESSEGATSAASSRAGEATEGTPDNVCSVCGSSASAGAMPLASLVLREDAVAAASRPCSCALRGRSSDCGGGAGDDGAQWSVLLAAAARTARALVQGKRGAAASASSPVAAAGSGSEEGVGGGAAQRRGGRLAPVPCALGPLFMLRQQPSAPGQDAAAAAPALSPGAGEAGAGSGGGAWMLAMRVTATAVAHSGEKAAWCRPVEALASGSGLLAGGAAAWLVSASSSSSSSAAATATVTGTCTAVVVGSGDWVAATLLPPSAAAIAAGQEPPPAGGYHRLASATEEETGGALLPLPAQRRVSTVLSTYLKHTVLASEGSVGGE